jgi:hypothetical protein
MAKSQCNSSSRSSIPITILMTGALRLDREEGVWRRGVWPGAGLAWPEWLCFVIFHRHRRMEPQIWPECAACCFHLSQQRGQSPSRRRGSPQSLRLTPSLLGRGTLAQLLQSLREESSKVPAQFLRADMIPAVRTFVASPEASVWAAQFYGKSPATRPFDDQWRAIAAHDPAGFESAQRAFIVRTNYSPGSQLVRRMAGFDLENANSAIRQAFFATAVQHGPTGGGALFARSVPTVDRRLKRTDRGYESALINTLYDNRTEQRRHFAQGARMRAAAFAKKHDSGNVANWNGKAQQADNDVIHRYPRERFDALLLLSGQPMSGW